MTSKTLLIQRLTRYPQATYGDEITFENGVNLLVGEKDSGKTKWLMMLDYLLGASTTPAEALGAEMAERYHTIEAEIVIGSENLKLRRSWTADFPKTKILVNDKHINITDLSDLLLDKLCIPKLNFPQGNMFSERSWPSLSFRMLLRHIYRQERFWSDLADKQPESEQHACLALFLGLAEELFTPKLGDLVGAKKQLQDLQTQKTAHQKLLHELVSGMFHHQEMSVSVTTETLQQTTERLRDELSSLDLKRQALIDDVRKKTEIHFDTRMQVAKKRIEEIEQQKIKLEIQKDKLTARVEELKSYNQVLYAELERLERVKSTNNSLADIKVTHCPVCDQPVNTPEDTQICYLCHRTYSGADTTAADKRVDFEKEQIQEENSELEHLIPDIEAKLSETLKIISTLDSEKSRLETDLRPAQQFAMSCLPPDIALLDHTRGRISEQLESLLGVEKSLALQKTLTESIKNLSEKEKRLEGEISNSKTKIDFEKIGEIFENKMIAYLTKINIADPNRWKNGPVSFQIKDRYFTLSPQKVGATSRALLYFAYHYALLSLVENKKFFYPGIVIIDFPLQLADGGQIRDKENYLIEPFVELCKKPGMENVQVIAAGHSFDGIDGAKIIPIRRPNDNATTTTS